MITGAKHCGCNKFNRENGRGGGSSVNRTPHTSRTVQRVQAGWTLAQATPCAPHGLSSTAQNFSPPSRFPICYTLRRDQRSPLGLRKFGLVGVARATSPRFLIGSEAMRSSHFGPPAPAQGRRDREAVDRWFVSDRPQSQQQTQTKHSRNCE